MSLSRSLPLRLSRSFATTSSCRSSQTPEVPSPPRRKGRIPRINPKTQSLLPPEKLRALVSLYHQSEDLITKENLEQRIDAAFSNPKQIYNDISQSTLDNMLKYQRDIPRISPWDLDPPLSSPGTTSSSWSSTISNKERQVIDALCGTETIVPDGQTLPGYGTLMESGEWKQKKLDGRTA